MNNKTKTFTLKSLTTAVCMGIATSFSSIAISTSADAQQINTTEQQESQTINIASGPLNTALQAIARQFRVNVIAQDTLVADKIVSAVNGEYTARSALEAVLANTALILSETASGAFVISAGQNSLDRNDVNEQGNALLQVSSEDNKIEKIQVTGTRIQRSAATAPSPVDIVTAQEIAQFGLTDVTEALRFVPSLNQSISLTTPPITGFPADSGQGFASLNLRGMGSSRTLVLVDGRRHVSGSPGEATVDITSIPQALIERVEVLTGGGSSIYGADAVSGVVNFILKDDFEGVDFRANTSQPSDSGAEAYSFAITAGGNFDDNRGNAVVSVDYLRQNELVVSQRGQVLFGGQIGPNNPVLAEFLGVDPSFRNVVVPDARQARFTAEGSFTFDGNSLGAPLAIANGTTTLGGFPLLQLFDIATGQVRPVDIGIFSSILASSGGDGVPSTAFNDNGFIVPDSEIINLNANADYEFLPGLTGFMEAKYSRNESHVVSLVPTNVINLQLSRDNPFLPQTVRDQYDALVAQGLTPQLNMTKSLTDNATSRPSENLRETFRVVGGIEGSLSPAFNYELSINYGKTEISQARNSGEIVVDRFLAATDAVIDPTTGDIVCRSTIDPTASLPPIVFPSTARPGFSSFTAGDGSCVPVNLFGRDTITDEAADFFQTRVAIESELEQVVINGVVTGSTDDFFTLPAGGISYAFGAEYREENSETRPDPLQVAQLTFTFLPSIEQGGEFDVTEGFAEVSIPVISDMPWAKRLSVDGSVRFANYSTVGSNTSYAFGTVWQPTENLRFRGSFNRAVRAPNIAELFTAQSTGFGILAPGSDPCDPNTATTPTANSQANCALLVPDNFDPTPSYQQGNILVTSGGNPNLQEETADTYTVGIVYSPEFISGLTFIADYYNIDIEGGVFQTGQEEEIVGGCANSPSLDNAFCDAVIRNPATGVVENILAVPLNLSAVQSEGIDYSLQYNFGLDQWLEKDVGDFSASLAGTYLIERQNVLFQDFPDSVNRFDGELGFPEHFVNFVLDWQYGPWQANYGFTYQSSQTRTDRRFGIEDIEADPLTLADPETGSAFVHYIGGAYTFDDYLTITFRINNLTDRERFEGIQGNTQIRPVSDIGRTVQLGLQMRL